MRKKRMVRLVENISENNISLKPARINTFNLSGGGINR